MEKAEQIDKVLNAAWKVVKNDFEDQAIRNWKKSARDCLVSLVGEKHYYTSQFDRQILELDKPNKMLVCCGILSAAREFARTDVSNVSSCFTIDKAS